MVLYTKVQMTNYITKEGLEKLKQELHELKTTKRKEISERLRQAIKQGDLSENFDYAQAREEQQFLELRIRELEQLVANATVSSPAQTSDKVQIGSQVTVESASNKLTLTIAGTKESSPAEGKISADSPLGSAILGKKQGESVEVETPQGKTKYKILRIE